VRHHQSDRRVGVYRHLLRLHGHDHRWVTPVLTGKGRLPVGVTFVDNGDGTGTLSGVPAPKGKKPPAGTYKLKVTAVFSYGGVTTSVRQSLVLTVT